MSNVIELPFGKKATTKNTPAATQEAGDNARELVDQVPVDNHRAPSSVTFTLDMREEAAKETPDFLQLGKNMRAAMTEQDAEEIPAIELTWTHEVDPEVSAARQFHKVTSGLLDFLTGYYGGRHDVQDWIKQNYTHYRSLMFIPTSALTNNLSHTHVLGSNNFSYRATITNWGVICAFGHVGGTVSCAFATD